MKTLYEIKSTNQRVWSAIASIRILGRNYERMCELYDALNARHYQRNVTLTHDERKAFDIEYLRQNAPDLLHTF